MGCPTLYSQIAQSRRGVTLRYTFRVLQVLGLCRPGTQNAIGSAAGFETVRTQVWLTIDRLKKQLLGGLSLGLSRAAG